MRIIRSIVSLGLAAAVSLSAADAKKNGVQKRGMNKLLKSKNAEEIYQAGLEAYRNKKYRNATIYFEAAYNDFYSSDRADTILFYTAKAYYNQGIYDIAADGFDQYRKVFSRRPFSEEAEYLLPMCWYNLSRPAERDQTETHKAIATFNEYLNRYPESIKAADIKEILEELQQKLYEKKFINTALYFKLRYYPASVAALRYALKDTPETPYREEMMYLICKSWYNYAKNSVPSKKLDRYMKMVDSYYNFRTEYPQSQAYLKDLDKMFREAKFYVDYNQKAAVDMEKDRIGAENLKESIKQQKAKLRTISDQLERNDAKMRLRQDETALKAQQARIKAEAKRLKKSDQKVRKEMREEQTAAAAAGVEVSQGE